MKKFKMIVVALVLMLTMVVVSDNINAATQTKCTAYKKTKKTYTRYCYKYRTGYKSYAQRIKYVSKKKNMKYVNRVQRTYIYKNKQGYYQLYKKYYFNKKGQLKTNKYGKAQRKLYNFYSNGKISKRTDHQYNKNGRLVKRKVYTKAYLKNKPLTFGQKIVKAGKSYNGQNMVCTEFVAKVLSKVKTKAPRSQWTSIGIVNGHEYKSVLYWPDSYRYSKAIVIKNSANYQYYVKYGINSKSSTMTKSQLISVSSQKSLLKNLKVGDIVEYNYGAHFAIYMGGNKVIQGGMPDKNGKLQKVATSSVNLGSKYKVTEIVRVYK